MGANSFSVNSAATSMSVTGGTALAFTETAKAVPSGIEVSAASVADFRVRPFVEFKNRQPVVQSDGSYSKAKREVKLVCPRLDANNKPYFDVVRITFEASPLTTDANQLDMRLMAGQILGLATLATFWSGGVVR